ncbi:acyl-CoA dehydrogenase family protein [Nocardia sp. NPDC049526]|uniref:acyl-CoA dehydrogenase family protein n=1 Tax=Nocardia sp. NPDC049526 TaxID=3364316 RepID=UPI003791A2B3
MNSSPDTIAHPLAALHARLTAVQMVIYRTAARIDSGLDDDSAAADSNIAKLLAADVAFDSADHAVQPARPPMGALPEIVRCLACAMARLRLYCAVPMQTAAMSIRSACVNGHMVLGATAWDDRDGLIDIYLDARLSRSGPVSNEFTLNWPL